MKTFFDFLSQVQNKCNNENKLSISIDKQVNEVSYKEFLRDVDNVANFLVSKKLSPQDKAVIMLDSSPTWVSCDLGIIKAGLISVPMFANISFENMAYQFNNCEAKIIFLQDESAFNKVVSTGYKFDTIVTLKPISKENAAKCKNSKIYLLEEVLNFKAESGLKDIDKKLEAIKQKVKEDDSVTIIYTSGTSGKPKGVELSHKNLISQLTSIDEDYGEVLKQGEDSVFSFLPLAHIFQRTVNYYFLYKCVNCHFSNDIKAIADNLEKFQPSAVAVVPRFLEKVKNGLSEKVNTETSIIKKFIGKLCLMYAANHNPNKSHGLLFSLYDKLMYSKVRKKFGGRLKVMLTGGAALPEEIYRFFVNVGIPLYQGYGLTETSPVVAVGTPLANKLYTVGKPIRGVEVKLTPDKELLVKGPNVMKGYYRVSNEGARAIDDEGFLHTGDLASIDEDGFIKIIGRKKEQFKTSNGKFINPIKIEAMLNTIPFIETSCVIAEGKPFVTVILFPSDEGALRLTDLESEVTIKIKEINERLDRHEHIHYFYLHNVVASIDDGQLTPSLKIIRTAIEKQFKDQIGDFYSKFH